MKHFRQSMLAGLAIALLALPVQAAPISITGDVTYRERIALPDDASLSVQLVDTSLPDAPARLRAEAQIKGPGQVPLQFSFKFDDGVIIPSHKYALVAEIYSGDVLLFRNATRYAIDPLAPAQPVVVVVNFIGHGPVTPGPVAPLPPAQEETVVPLQPEPSAALYGPVWRLTDLAGFSVSPKVTSTLTFSDDGRAGGSGGCNSYFTQAVFNGNAIGFGQAAATQMACLGGTAMAQEAAFLSAFTNVRTFHVDGTVLSFLDAGGGLVMRFKQQ